MAEKDVDGMNPSPRKNPGRLWLYGLISLALFAAMAIHSAPLTPSIPAIQFTYDEAAFKAVLAQWGPDGIARFRKHFFIDFPFLISYGIFGYRLAKFGLRPGKPGALAKSLLTWALPAAALLDAAENALHLSFIAEGANPMAGAYLLAGLVATGKWVLIAFFVVGFIRARRR